MPTGDSGLPVGHGRRADDLLALKRPSTDVSKWPVAEIHPLRPKRRLADEVLAAKVNSRAGSRRRTTGHERPLAFTAQS